jgi:alcohol dehydrogenase class IV
MIDGNGVPPFEHVYDPADVEFGRGAVDDLGDALAERGVERALVVCGSHVGANDDLQEPLRAGLGDRLAGVYDGTTPDKAIEGVYGGVERMKEVDVDGIVAVGGGSSIDVARAMRALFADFHDREAVKEAGRIGLPEEVDLAPLAVVPTTFAGADLSAGGSVSFPDGARAGIRDMRLMPDVCCYDPALFETTPAGALRGSAMNGFDKGIETCYTRNRTPITDATAVRGLRYLASGLPDMIEDDDAMERAVAGIVLVQYGIKRPGVQTLGPIHAFGHSLRNPIQQGVAHAIAAPHVVRDVLDADDSGLSLLAEGFGVAEDPASVVAAVREVRDALGLPSRLRDVDGPDRADLPDVAEATRADSTLEGGPAGYDPSVDDLQATLERMW